MVSARAFASLAMLCVVACSDATSAPRTQLVLVAGTDISAIQTVRFDVSQGQKRKSSQGEVDLDTPAFVNLLYQGGSLGPVDVVVEGRDAKGQAIVSRRARVSFVAGKTRAVTLHLLSRCVDTQASCDDDQTCTEAGCNSFVLEEKDLEDWTGTPPKPDRMAPMDASTPEDANGGGQTDASGGGNGDASGASSAGNDASAGDNDAGIGLCDGQIVDLSSDVAHCGKCDAACVAGPHQSRECRGARCIYTCEAGFADCAIADGCESDLTAAETCGSCANKCKGQTRMCVDMVCVN